MRGNQSESRVRVGERRQRPPRITNVGEYTWDAICKLRFVLSRAWSGDDSQGTRDSREPVTADDSLFSLRGVTAEDALGGAALAIWTVVLFALAAMGVA